MLQVVWLPEANAELNETFAYYENISPELGQRFVAASVDAVEAIATSPFRLAVVQQDKRRAGIRRFPYGLFFLIEETRTIVIACLHGRRNPKHWQLRPSG